MGIYIRSLFFCYPVFCVISCFVTISVGKRELVNLHLLSSRCLLTNNILWLLLTVHAGIQDFVQGGGVQARRPENSLDNVFLSSTYFTVCRGGPMI